jgi:hypothetical protein
VTVSDSPQTRNVDRDFSDPSSLQPTGNGPSLTFGRVTADLLAQAALPAQNVTSPPQPSSASVRGDNPLVSNLLLNVIQFVFGSNSPPSTDPAAGNTAPADPQAPPKKFLSYEQLGLGNIENPNRIDVDQAIKNSPKIALTITNVAEQMGLNPRGLIAFGQKESSLNPNTVSPSGLYKGLYQISDEIAERYGIDPFEPAENARAAFSEMKKEVGQLSTRTGVPENEIPAWMIYLLHQQGDAGGTALASAYVDPNAKGRLAHEVIQEEVKRRVPNSSTDTRRNLQWNIPQEYVDAHKNEYKKGMTESEMRYEMAGKITVEEMVNAIRSRLGPAGDEPILAPSPQTVAKK